MSDDFDTLRMNLEDNIRVLWQKYSELSEKVNKLYRRDYIRDNEVDSLHAEIRALRLRVRELEEKEKRSGSSRPDF